jgi:hypothetical protein
MDSSAGMRLLATLMAAAALAGCSGGSDGAGEVGAGVGHDAGFANDPGRLADFDVAAPAPANTSRAASPIVAASLPPRVFAMTRHRIMDPSGFEKPMLAATALVPAGWKADGKVVWAPHGQCGPDYALQWQALSPDASSAVSMLPAPNWMGVRTAFPFQQSDTCPQAFHTSAREWLEATARQILPGARVLDYRSLDEEVRPLREMLAQLPPLPVVQGFEGNVVIEAGEILVAFEENGRDMRAALSGTATIARTRLADIMTSQLIMDQVQGTPSGITLVKAPNGSLDLDLRRRVLTSVRYDSGWARRIAEFNARKQAQTAQTSAQIMSMNAAASADRLRASQAAHEARMGSLRETQNIMNGIYEDRQLTNDRMHRERIEAIRGVETYADPVAGAPVQLDNNYQHAWRVNGRDDTYILSNDVNFDPRNHGVDAQQLQRLP